MNLVVVSGNLGQDPELRYTPKGVAVANMSLCVNGRRDAEGKPANDWFRVVCFKKVAENVNEFVAKGHKILVRGELRTRSYDDREGQKRTVTEIWANNIEFLTPKRDAGAGTTSPGKNNASGNARNSTPPSSPGTDDPFGGMSDDDVPF